MLHNLLNNDIQFLELYSNLFNNFEYWGLQVKLAIFIVPIEEALLASDFKYSSLTFPNKTSTFVDYLIGMIQCTC